MRYYPQYRLRSLMLVVTLVAVAVVMWTWASDAYRRAKLHADVAAQVESWLQEAYTARDPEPATVMLEVLRDLVLLESELSPNSQSKFLRRIDDAIADMHHRSKVLRAGPKDEGITIEEWEKRQREGSADEERE